MSVFSSAVHGVTRNHLGYSLKRSIWLNRTQDAYAAATRQLSTTAARYNASSSSPRPARIAQDEPSNRTGGSPRAWQTTAKPDHFLSPAAFKVSNGASGDSAAAAYVKHPLPGIDDSSSTSSRSLLWEGGELKIHDNVENRSTRIPSLWLRDNCSCSQCRNMDTAQRKINVLKGGFNTALSDVQLDGANNGQITVTFGDGHRSIYTARALLKRRSEKIMRSRNGVVPIQIWNSEIASGGPAVQYAEVLQGAGMAALLHKIRTYGFCVVEDMPATSEATEAFLTSVGPIRNTHYGGFYDFTSDLTMKDTAYTSEFLEPHTDNTYFTEPAGIQALHMLSHTEGSGGESSLIDGFNAATQLYAEDREAYLTLSELGVYAHASGNEGISIQPSRAFPVLNHDPEEGFLTQVRWNNADRAGIAANFEGVEKWYAAAAKFDRLLSDVKNQYWFQLKPGQTLLFDNWRVLHGRNQFTGKRRMCGGYINRDDFISKYRMTNMAKEDLEVSTVSG